jgi:hypothetical protein
MSRDIRGRCVKTSSTGETRWSGLWMVVPDGIESRSAQRDPLWLTISTLPP